MIRSNVRTRFVALASAIALLAGCGGGGTSSSSLLPGQPGKTPSLASTTFIVKIPAKSSSSSSKRPHYITANVKAIDFTVSQTANTLNSSYVFYKLTPQSTYCTNATSGLTCTLQVQAAAGEDTFVVNLYDSTEPGQGFIVATGDLVQTISAQTANTISITTDGVPTLVNLGFGNAYPATGAATSTPVTMNIADPDGDIIVGSYDMPLQLTDSDTSGATTLSKTTISQASDATGLTLSYTGAVINAVNIAVVSTSPSLASRYGSASTTLTNQTFEPGGSGPNAAPSTVYFANVNSAAQTLTVTGGPGSIGPFTVNGCSNNVTVTGTSPTFTITPVGSTTSPNEPAYLSPYFPCELAVTDANSNTTYVSTIVGL